MLRTVARTTDVEPGHVRAFEVRDDGAEAVGRSRIPLLKAMGVGRSEGDADHPRERGRHALCHRRHVHPQGLLSGRWEARRVHGPVRLPRKPLRRHERCGRARSGRGPSAQLPRPRRQRRGPGRPVACRTSRPSTGGTAPRPTASIGSLDARPSSNRSSGSSRTMVRGRAPSSSRGPAGIGKSTLLDAAVDAARERSVEVLRCGPGEHESRLSFAALRDLLEHAYDETAAKLPAPQRRALAVALLREEPEAPLDRGAVSAAFLTLLRERSRIGPRAGGRGRRPVARPTDGFRARVRHPPSPRRACRARARAPVAAAGRSPSASTGRCHRIDCTASLLGRSASARSRRCSELAWAVRGRGPSCAASTRASDGNPFFALEIARALERDSVESGIRPSRPPGPRGAAPGADRRASCQCALGPPGRLGVLPADAGPGRGRIRFGSARTHDALAAAERAGVIETVPATSGSRTRCWRRRSTRAPRTDERRAVHRALADLATDPEERARHLALSSRWPRRVDRGGARRRRATGAGPRRAGFGSRARRPGLRAHPARRSPRCHSPRRRGRRPSVRRRQRDPGAGAVPGDGRRDATGTGAGGHPVAPRRRLVDGGRSRQGLSPGGPGRCVG